MNIMLQSTICLPSSWPQVLFVKPELMRSANRCSTMEQDLGTEWKALKCSQKRSAGIYLYA
jgi:hypothetical protein